MSTVHLTTPYGSFRCYRDSIGDAIEAGRFWDVQLRPAIDATANIAAGGWALDLGANVGWFTVYLAQRFAHVLAVEAHPQTFLHLLENLRTNGVADRVTPVLAAAYSTHAMLSLARPELHGWDIPDPGTLEGSSPSSIGFFPDPTPWAFQVPGVPLSSCLDPATPVALIKSDVQGCDYRALVGLLPTIERWRPTILFELEAGMQVWHGEQDGIQHFETLLGHLNYTVRRIWLNHWDYVAVPQESPLATMQLAPTP
jgi:FkbM family methyltransferase